MTTEAPPGARHGSLLEIAVGLPLTFAVAVGTREPAVWFLLPLGWTLARGRSLEDLGFRFRLTPPSAGVQLALGLAGAVLLALFLGLVTGGLVRARWPDDLGRRALHALFGTAVPEETFFRGWLQERLGVALRECGLTERVEVAVVLQALAFTTCHVLVTGPIGMATLPFGLAAGWLRARSGSILAPALWHAAANLAHIVLLGPSALP